MITGYILLNRHVNRYDKGGLVCLPISRITKIVEFPDRESVGIELDSNENNIIYVKNNISEIIDLMGK